MSGTGRGAASLALGLLVAFHAGAATFPPELRFRSLRTERVTLHFPKELEAMARQAASLADDILKRHDERYGVRTGRVQIVLADIDDDPNGSATPFPYPLVYIRAASPDGSDELGNHDGWLRLVLTHELAHIVHLGQARGIVGAGRKLLGRAPFLFPNALTPMWMVEGLANYEETQGTAFGRGRDPDARMALRIAALDGAFPREDQAVSGLDAWPQGRAGYFFGEAFLRNLTEAYGEQTLPELARVHSGHIIPFLDEFTARKVTRASFENRWNEWSAAVRGAFELEAEDRRAEGLTQGAALTERGVRQQNPRFSPDGRFIAYTSGTLDAFGQIRVMQADGRADRALTWRNGGTSLAWTPDRRTLVYDEPDTYHLFRHLSDLRSVDVLSGRVRWLTRGVRARDPDVSQQGTTIVFVRRLGDRSELCSVAIDGTGLRQITQSAPATEWSGPRFSPSGRFVVASRWADAGFLDLVLVDAETGEQVALTRDRAKDVEPTWLPDGSGIVFRSDRDGVSNLYLLRLPEKTLERITNVLGGAFTPDLAPDGQRIAFASYKARGYDLQLLERSSATTGLPAPPFVDSHPESARLPQPFEGADRAYRPWSGLWPRYWLPYIASEQEGVRLGALTSAADPLLRNAYTLELRYGTATERLGVRAAYQYDRFLPTFFASVEDTTDPGASFDARKQELVLGVSVPLYRSQRASQSLSAAWRRRRDSLLGGQAQPLDLGGLEAAYTLTTAQRYPYSISPVDGGALRVSLLKEAPAFGSTTSLAKLSGDARTYAKLGGAALALRLGGGATLGSPAFSRSYAVGGFPDGALDDLARTNQAVLRGYPDGAFVGRSYVSANAELRIPLAHPQRGWRSFPAFVRHLHATAFFDAANAWNGAFRMGDLKPAAGVAIGADTNIGQGLPLTFSAGVAWGFADAGLRRGYFRLGLAF